MSNDMSPKTPTLIPADQHLSMIEKEEGKLVSVEESGITWECVTLFGGLQWVVFKPRAQDIISLEPEWKDEEAALTPVQQAVWDRDDIRMHKN